MILLGTEKRQRGTYLKGGRAQSSYYSILIKYTPYVSRICDPTIDLQTWYDGTLVQNLSKKSKKIVYVITIVREV